MKHPIKTISQINEWAETADLESVNAKASASKGVPTTDEVLSFLKVVSPLLILVLNFAKIFTNEKADAKIDETISWLQHL